MKKLKRSLPARVIEFLVIIGPCSADNEDAVCDYANRLAKVQEATKDQLIIIPRVYTNKPRTTGEGYMGMLHQPDPEKAGYASGDPCHPPYAYACAPGNRYVYSR